MTPELQKYYEDRLEMMSSQAWKDLMVDVQKMYDTTNQLHNANLDNFQIRQGELNIMRWVLSIKEISETAYEDLQNEDHA